MGFKTDLQSNNTDLQTILDAINELPEAGEGGIDTSGDTVTPETLVTGYTAHDASGEPITGVNPYELESTNATVEEQADLIVQIQTALEGKAGGGGSSGGGSVETCTVEMSPDNEMIIIRYLVTRYVNGEIVSEYNSAVNETQTILENVVKGSSMVCVSDMTTGLTITNATVQASFTDTRNMTTTYFIIVDGGD